MQAVSAQSLATGRSIELAHEELARVTQAGFTLLCIDDAQYPAQLEANLRSANRSVCTGECTRDLATWDRGGRYTASDPLRAGNGGAAGL